MCSDKKIFAINMQISEEAKMVASRSYTYSLDSLKAHRKPIFRVFPKFAGSIFFFWSARITWGTFDHKVIHELGNIVIWWMRQSQLSWAEFINLQTATAIKTVSKGKWDCSTLQGFQQFLTPALNASNCDRRCQSSGRIATQMWLKPTSVTFKQGVNRNV